MFQCSIPALITPFCNGAIDFFVLETLIGWHIEEGSSALVIAGSTGEAPTLEDDEFKALISFSVKHAKGKIPIIVGTGTNATKTTVFQTKLAKELGAEGALVVVPYYNRPTDDGLRLHFEEVGKIALPMIIYNHPGRTGRALSASLLAELADFEHVVAIKDCSGQNSLTKEILEIRPHTVILSGDDERTLPMMENGALGCISVIANLFPSKWKEMIALKLERRDSEAAAIFESLSPLLNSIGLESNPIGIKCALAQRGLCENELRLPLTPATKGTQKAIKEAFALFTQPNLSDSAK